MARQIKRKADTGEPGNPGQFGSLHRGESEVAVDTEQAPEPAFDHRSERVKVLEKYDLTDEDVPGLTEAWDEHFAVLDQPRPETRHTVAGDILGDQDPGRLRGTPSVRLAAQARDDSFDPRDYGLTSGDPVVEIYTRNGGGNRECYHEDDDSDHEDGCTGCIMDDFPEHPQYITDFDDSFDATYATIILSVPDDQKERALAAMDDRDAEQLESEQAKATAEVLSYHRGDTPPWRLLADQESADAASREIQEIRRQSLDTWTAKRIEESAKTERLVVQALDEGTEIPPFEGRVTVPSRYLSGRTLDRTHRDLNSTLRKVLDAEQEHEKLQGLWEKAQAIEDPELRSWLVDDRPTRSYSTSEGKGRSKRTVRREYTPKSDLKQEVDRAQGYYDSAQEDRAEIESVRTSLAQSEQKLADHRAAEEKIRAAEHARWSLGWSGEGDAPPRPEKSTSGPW